MTDHEGKDHPSPADDLNAIVVQIVANVSRVAAAQRMETLQYELTQIDPEWRSSVEALVQYSLETGVQAGQLQAQAEAEKKHRETMKKRRKRLVWFSPIAVLVLLVFLLPRLMSLWGNASVVVPQSHFVGEHGGNKKLIVFVHGVLGDMDNTWVNPITHSSWPEMIKSDSDFSSYDVFVYGYSTPIFTEASRIDEIAKRFGQQLKDWKMFRDYEEIDFITHSMGGIITKKMLNSLNTPPDFGFLQRVHCVIYMAVPSNGAQSAALASWLSLNPQFKSMDPNNAASFLATVEDDWAALLRARSDRSPFPRTFSAYEKLPIHGLLIVRNSTLQS